jgi:CRP/FNR family transcriptional regulator, cyclic AMP receptor protein
MQHQSSEFRCRLGQMLESCGLSGDLAAEIEDHLIQVTYEKGAVIFLRGAPCDLIFWLLKGFVKLYLPHDDGTRTLVDLARPGDFLGFVNDKDSKGRRHLLEAHALTRCSVGLFTRDQIAMMLSRLDQTGTIHLLEQLNVAWSTMFERYVSFLGSSFRNRLEMVLNSLGARFGIDDKRGTLLALELSHEDLAEMIGSSRPMVSKLIGEMIQEGLLARGEKRHFILRSKQGSSLPASDDIPSHVQWNRDLKQAGDARFYTGARSSTNVPFPTPKRSVQPPA